MVEMVHGRDMIVHDNNWRSVLFGDGDVRICDFDAISPPRHASPRLKSVEYSSREQLLTVTPTFAGDLEGFALMIDSLLIGGHLITAKTEEKHVIAARINNRKYDKRRQAKLPHHIREVVTPMLTYPRDNSIQASDFVSAISADYRM
jgi:hypothetical protein